ncbi:MAG TPA: HupE/UreJ family protein [Terriglobales bacterium]
MKYFWQGCALLISGLLFVSLWGSPAAQAHEARPAYLEIKETAQGHYTLLWRTPVLAGMRLPIALKLPDDVKNLREPSVEELADSLVERHWIDAGQNGLEGKSIEFPGLQATITDVIVRVELLDGRSWTAIVRPSQPRLEITPAPGRLAVARAYVRLGIEHILTGVDHLLFVSGLLLLVSGVRRLLFTVSAFTLSHTITLTLATLGFVHVPPAPVEAVIALSILFVAYEVLRKNAYPEGLAQRKPWLVAFSFGLLHGLGFAGGLSAAGLPVGHIPLALGFFSAGVEVGHFSFVACALALIISLHRWTTKLPTWSSRIPPYAIGGISAYWLIARIAAF